MNLKRLAQKGLPCLAIPILLAVMPYSSVDAAKSIPWSTVIRHTVPCFDLPISIHQVVYRDSHSALVLIQCNAEDGAAPGAVLYYSRLPSSSAPPSPQVLLSTKDGWVPTMKMSVMSRRVTLHVAGYSSPGTPRCCADISAVLAWKWQGGEYREISKEPPHARI
jgi:hypothetical protein